MHVTLSQLKRTAWRTFFEMTLFVFFFNTALLRGIIADHKATFDAEHPRDFIDSFLIEMKKDQSGDFSVSANFKWKGGLSY